MLMGEYNHSLDAKGRVILPADFRVELGESFIITKGLDNCLFIYPQSEWEQLSVKLRQLPLAKTEARAFVRFFFAGARQVELDKQGRFLIPATLRQHASLKKDAVLIGVSNRIEVWSKDEWLKYNEEITPSVSAIAETLAELGI
ncbi:MAG TPA: transcriptional regulator MraZ [Anaerovibrio sp.]|jgi:MraZ protein|uniref:Transcriptional regulator MraZ n=1 Tax=Anaerovibrio lipolyticus DSM 3074 TaxID=1120997 RepID=A0A1M6B5H0_9FIRM|nr:division/cell wall cluster transcriptional repressor MraZ [Anaerovibrio lipolyticus]MBQ1855733.1 division/cell wall cluster transcriptional repressor MraZ [Anaerovibrio sp.]MBE6106975.1 division/cell wall cluster transcriptional repressor MraZ [Anaerovibrio lipolyticus]MBE6106981.1 division/cell wall cluster transcriptional repressor MraZ [Anaerovibrio lipolyticus]SHI43907.1 MraZ protein [Anaerovibrio lipolyticus DSM 3074]HAQ55582.1 transcriptional regulator MraZ [Anaerovibrio sp.]